MPEEARQKWLERLFEAHAADSIPYIESLADYWGDLCASPSVASLWADRLLDATRTALCGDKKPRDHFYGASACLSALFAAARYNELLAMLRDESWWGHKCWAVKALAAQGKETKALELAEASRGPWANDLDIDCLCEEILRSTGQQIEAYARYGLRANRAGTYAAWFKAVTKKYSHKQASEILQDLVATTPGEEGKWFAAAKGAGLFDEAIALAKRSPCSPQTLTRAARDFASKRPEFAIEAGMTALYWLVEGFGYEVTTLDVLNAYNYTIQAAENAGVAEATRDGIRSLVAREVAAGHFVTKTLGRRVGLS